MIGTVILAGLRFAFLGLLYYFLWLVLRAAYRELGVTARSASRKQFPSLSLVVVNSPHAFFPAGQRFAVGTTTTIGREAGNDIVIPVPYVSSRHCVIRYQDRQGWLEDLGSRNGTYVNGQRVTGPVKIVPNDLIGVGDVTLQLTGR